MTEYVTIKLSSGQDIIGVVEAGNVETGENVLVNNPIQVVVDPHQGLYAKSYLLFSEETSCVFSKKDIIHMSKASTKATQYYDDFVVRITTGYQTEDADYSMSDDDNDDLEDMFTTMLEAKSSIKH